jgi:divalent metal cation (Fe/Co/Zn/Cd) transporter
MAQVAERPKALILAIRLEVVTVAWMAVEAVLAIGAGIVARSVVLTAFGFDSVVELLSGVVLLWRLSVEARGAAAGRVDRFESRATRISAVLLVLVCAYVVLSSIVGVALGLKPEGSLLGIGVAAAAVVGMPLLAAAKSRANQRLMSAALRADIAETVTCAYMAVVTLAGLAVAMLTGVWWLQYVAALLLLVWLIPETREALSGGDDAPGREGAS